MRSSANASTLLYGRGGHAGSVSPISGASGVVSLVRRCSQRNRACDIPTGTQKPGVTDWQTDETEVRKGWAQAFRQEEELRTLPDRYWEIITCVSSRQACAWLKKGPRDQRRVPEPRKSQALSRTECWSMRSVCRGDASCGCTGLSLIPPASRGYGWLRSCLGNGHHPATRRP